MLDGLEMANRLYRRAGIRLGVISNQVEVAAARATRDVREFLHTGSAIPGNPSAGAWTTYGLGSEGGAGQGRG